MNTSPLHMTLDGLTADNCLGATAWWDLESVMVDGDEAERLWLDAGLDPALAPSVPDSRAAFRKACGRVAQSAQTGDSALSVLLRPTYSGMEDADTYLIAYEAVLERRNGVDANGKRNGTLPLEYECAGEITFRRIYGPAQPGQARPVQHERVQVTMRPTPSGAPQEVLDAWDAARDAFSKVRAEWQRFDGTVWYKPVKDAIQAALESEGMIRLKRRGGVYFVPFASLPAALRVQQFCRSINQSLDLLPMHNRPSEVSVIHDAAVAVIASLREKMAEEVAAFKAKATRPSSVVERVQGLARIKALALTYQKTVGLQAEAVLADVAVLAKGLEESLGVSVAAVTSPTTQRKLRREGLVDGDGNATLSKVLAESGVTPPAPASADESTDSTEEGR